MRILIYYGIKNVLDGVYLIRLSFVNRPSSPTLGFVRAFMNMLPAEVLDRFQDLPATYAFHDVRSVWILCIEELNHVGDQMPCTAGNNRSSKRSKFTLAKYFKVVEMAGFYWPQRTQQFLTLWNMLQKTNKMMRLASPCPLQDMKFHPSFSQGWLLFFTACRHAPWWNARDHQEGNQVPLDFLHWGERGWP